MYKKSITILFVFLVALLLSGCNQEKSDLKEIKVDDTIFRVEVVKTPKEQAKGLSGRENLGERRGMLFVYGKPKYASFWMKGMLIPLDFVWIREGEVVRIDEKVQPEDYQPPKTLSPREKIDQVLEVKSGTVEKFNIKVGDKVEFRK